MSHLKKSGQNSPTPGTKRPPPPKGSGPVPSGRMVAPVEMMVSGLEKMAANYQCGGDGWWDGYELAQRGVDQFQNLLKEESRQRELNS